MTGSLVVLIVTCEVSFWLVLGAGLVARYLLRWSRMGAVLLAAAPVMDLVLLTATVAGLRSGGAAGPAHGMAAVYLGFSVAFGPVTLRWADARFAHRFAGGPLPQCPPQYGRARAQYEWRLWVRALAGWAVACGLLGLVVLGVGDPARTTHLIGWMEGLTTGLVIWALLWPLSHTLWPTAPPPPQPMRAIENPAVAPQERAA